MFDNKWIGLAYIIPATPSKGRVFVWRHLKSMGAKIVKPGLAALPNTPENVKKFDQLAFKIESFQGQASLLEFDFFDDEENEQLQKEFQSQEDKEYEEMLDKCRNIIKDINRAKGKDEKKLLEGKLLTTIRTYDNKADMSLLSKIRKDIGNAAEEIFSTLKTVPSEIISVLKK